MAWLERAFAQATAKAAAIRFELSSFAMNHPKSGVTMWELQQVLGNPELLRKTVFVRDGARVVWDGKGFAEP